MALHPLQAWGDDRGEGLTTTASHTPTALESARDRELIRTVVVPDHDDLVGLLADRIVDVINRETAAKGRAVLGLATGSTPIGVYRELIRRHQAGSLDFSRVVTFNLDEYYPMPKESQHSYFRWMHETLDRKSVV